MVKINLLFGLAISFAILVSCDNVDLESLNSTNRDNKVTSISFKVSESNSSTSNLADDFETRNTIKYSGTWTAKPGLQNWFYKEDTLGIFPQVGDQIPFPLTSVTVEDTKFEFYGTGWELLDTIYYYAYFPFSRKNYKDAENINHIYVNFFGQVQEKSTALTNNNVNFVRDSQCPYLYMYSTPTIADAGGNLSFALEYLSSSIRFLAMVPCAGTPVVPANSRIILVKFVADDPIFTLEGTYDLDSIAAEKQSIKDAGLTITSGSSYDPMYITPSKRGKTNVLSLRYDSLKPNVASTNMVFYGHVLLPKTNFNCPFTVNVYDADLNWWRKQMNANSITNVYGGNTTYANLTGFTYMGKATPNDIKVEPWDEEEETINSNWNYK